MQITRQQVIDEARKYLGTPYANQGRSNEMLDCGGLLILVCRALGITEVEYLGYSNRPDGVTFERLLDADLDEVIPKEAIEIGDIIACDYSKPGENLGIQHTGFCVETFPRIKILHAKREKGVIEQYLHGGDRKAWTKTFRIRGITD